MRIQHNIPAMNAYRNYSNNTSALSKNLEKLSSGYKINRAGDDAAGLAISEKMRAQITGLSAAQKNVKDGISLVKTAEGAMQEIHDMLNRMDYLATQSANGTYDNEVDRLNLQKEVDSLKAEINRIADSANFNGIKLLDGSLGEKVTDTMSIPTEAINMTDGVTINSPVDGAATKASMSIEFNQDNLFSAGDGLTFKVTDADGNEQTISTSGNISGATFADQMTDLATKVNTALGNASIDEYTAVATEKGIKIEAKGVDVPEVSLVADSAAIVRDSAVATANITTPGANITNTDAKKADHQGFSKLLGGDTAAVKDLENGDKLQFKFEVNGKDMTVTLEAGADADKNGFKIGATNEETTANIVTALNAAKFDKNDATGVSEELLKVSDYFTATANKQVANGTTAEVGSIHFAAATGAGKPAHTAATNVKGLEIQYKDTTKGGGTGKATVNEAGDGAKVSWSAGTTGGAAAIAQVTTVSMNGKNMAAGDKFVLEGNLSDGRTFKVELDAIANGETAAGNQFALGTDVEGTFDAIVARLGSADVKIQVTNPDNSVEEVDANKLFGSGMEFTAAKAGSGDAATMTITSNTAGAPGKGVAGSINRAYTVNAAAPEITDKGTVTAGKAPSASENSLTFDPNKVEQGTTLTIDGKTYEFVDGSDPGRFVTHEDNIAVAVDGLNAKTATGADLANALKDAMGATYTSADNKAYDVTAEGSTITIKSQAVDGTGTALEITVGDSKPSTTLSINGGKKEVLGVEEETDISSIKVGDTVTINGKVYEFTSGKRTQNENAIQVDIKDITDDKGVIKASDVATKLADTVNANDEDIIARADGKDVIFTSKYNAEAVKAEDAYAAPKVELPKTSNSLTLQIGDTADKFNQMEVKVGDMHVAAMGIDGISVAKQEDAQAAIDVIKGAINYVSGVRGDLGAVQNRLDHTANNLSVMQENIQDAESTIRDTDVAEEMMSYVKNNILVQSAQAMLAQANQLPQGVLQLLG